VRNAAHGGWTKVQSNAALKLLAALYAGCVNLSSPCGQCMIRKTWMPLFQQ
jgi:hypothetical protein